MLHVIKKHKHVLFLLFLLAAGFAGWVHTHACNPGSLSSGTMGVSTSVTNNCKIKSITNLAFGSYDPTLGTGAIGSGTFTLLCTKGMPVTNIDIDKGQHPSTTSIKRQMQGPGSGTEVLQYDLYQPANFDYSGGTGGTCPGTVLWGGGVAGGAVLAAGSSPGGVGFSIPVCGKIPAGSNVSAGSYADQVTITVNF